MESFGSGIDDMGWSDYDRNSASKHWSHESGLDPRHRIGPLQNSQQFGQHIEKRSKSLPSQFGQKYDHNSARNTLGHFLVLADMDYDCNSANKHWSHESRLGLRHRLSPLQNSRQFGHHTAKRAKSIPSQFGKKHDHNPARNSKRYFNGFSNTRLHFCLRSHLHNHLLPRQFYKLSPIHGENRHKNHKSVV
jgi:hypothetical protein